MRLHPPNCPAIERLVPSGGISIHGYYLPGGTNIAMSAYAVHRNTSIYGADANRFRPERWLDADPASKKLMEASFMAVSISLFRSRVGLKQWKKLRPN